MTKTPTLGAFILKRQTHDIAMTTKDNRFMPLSAKAPSDQQRTFLRYFSAVLLDLVVLNLFAEYWTHVHVTKFSISLLAAILLAVLLKLTLAIEHWLAEYFKARPGAFMTFMRFFSAWLVLFGSKFVILEALTFTFGDSVSFGGPINGVVALIVVIITMLAAEEVAVRIFRKLG